MTFVLQFKVEKGRLMRHHFVDDGNHWCKPCKVVNGNIHDYVQHIGSNEHKKVHVTFIQHLRSRCFVAYRYMCHFFLKLNFFSVRHLSVLHGHSVFSLEASTIPQGYRGGGTCVSQDDSISEQLF